MKLFFTLILLFITLAPAAQAYTLDSSGASPIAIFKCQTSTITANYSDFAAITAVTAWVNSSSPVLNHMSQTTTQQTAVILADLGAGQWSGTYPADSTQLYGNRSISFDTTAAGITTNIPSDTYLLVYSDTCTGTGDNYTTQVDPGLGNYTGKIWRGEVNLLEFAVLPWTDVWGYLFYLVVLFIIVIVVYLKTEQITQPVIVAAVGLGMLAGTTAVPDNYRQYIITLLGASLGALFYRLYIKR